MDIMKSFNENDPREDKIAQNGKARHIKILLFKGLCFSFLSGMAFSTCSVIVKSAPNMPPEQFAVYRFLGMIVFSFPGVVIHFESHIIPSSRRILLLILGVSAGSAALCLLSAFTYMPLGEASVIIFSFPIFISIISRIFFKEKFGIFQSAAIILFVIGIILSTRLPLQFSRSTSVFSKEYTTGFLLAVGSVASNISVFIVTRQLVAIHPSIVVFLSSCTAFTEAVVLTALLGRYQWHDCSTDKIYVIATGMLGYLGQLFQTMAVGKENLGPVAMVRCSTEIAMGFIWQITLFQDSPDAYSASGAALVELSVIVLGIDKWLSALS